MNITWITDDRGNKCSVEYWGSEETARKALDKCSHCSDCSYIAAVNACFAAPLSGPELRWARDACDSGIAPKRFAGWLALTASSPFPLALPADGEGEPPSGSMKARRGTDSPKEN